MSIVQQIIKLQNIDSQLQDIAELLWDLPIKVESLREEETSLISSLEKGKLRLKELDLGLNKFNGQLKDINIKIDKQKDQLFLVTNNKQYDALQLEIDHLKTELDEIEMKSLDYTEEKEELENRIRGRATDSEEAIQQRLIRASDELKAKKTLKFISKSIWFYCYSFK